jgi:hypothetical protein
VNFGVCLILCKELSIYFNINLPVQFHNISNKLAQKNHDLQYYLSANGAEKSYNLLDVMICVAINQCYTYAAWGGGRGSISC